jgi:hypothetical protein
MAGFDRCHRDWSLSWACFTATSVAWTPATPLPRTKARLAVAKHPVPLTRGVAGKRAEILLDRQVALLITNNAVRTITVSSGEPSTPTPPGRYRVYAKIPRWWSTPFREWLPWAHPFVGGIAFHEFQVVPIYPASHECAKP